ncbi:hypothetical protein PF005_g9896 [Phytophthora fragariae]|uniref:RxLR effector protein n=1 Tax=Phytophthora fragariae TaxID=53985 RepID=A0A6A3SS43_9STRA|nr:hypothetical protein PF003_g3219 [Phytophthora fragariae]KAE8939163.1 hypothetical protein PF009_g10982 [Phytophthora fragariae]KAE9005220.1 hypothetical protein PF011_g12141 [Phytophthora fragariae]KAE9122596.1 hypothetical protein PF007_g7388 [Phytophthora fragariae]KAE9124007.1 hypothetical protein PF010_g6175 [Phytophthora fragariae]
MRSITARTPQLTLATMILMMMRLTHTRKSRPRILGIRDVATGRHLMCRQHQHMA